MTQTYGYGQNYSYESGCDHTAITEVMKIGKAKIWAGSKYQAESEYGWALAVPLLGHTFSTATAPVMFNSVVGDLLPKSLAAFKPVPVMSIDWPDGAIPPLKAAWWEEFFQALHKVEGDVVIYCQGGHGRTGTALSILAAKIGLLKKGCPVLWVRKNYCAKAVETTAQINYISDMTGVKPKTISSYAMEAQKREKEEAARKRANPTVAPQGASTETSVSVLVEGSQPSGETKTMTDGAGDEWVVDPQTGLYCRRSELDQDWSRSHHRFGAF